MEERKRAGQGLQYVFWGTVIAAVGNLRSINAVIGGIAAIAGAVLVLYGLYTAMPAHPYYRLAISAQLAGVVMSVLRMIFDSGLLGGLFSILGVLVALLSTGLVCTATGELLRAKPDEALAGRARPIVLLYALCSVVSIACTLVSWIPILNVLAAVTGAITSVVMLIAQVLEVIFYYQASKSLSA